MKTTRRIIPLCIWFFIYLSPASFSQSGSKQVVRGQVIDNSSGQPIAAATVLLVDSDLSTSTDSEGNFQLRGIPIGRYQMRISHTGYHTWTEREMLVNSGKSPFLTIALDPATVQLEDLEVETQGNRDQPLNDMALLGGRQISVEEASRYAGSMDDPGRLVGAMAGVAPTHLSSNGVSVRGNAPALLQWRLEGVEIPNPNHFADLEALGGGFLSALSPNVLGNSDFFQGAFPAEYNNAIAGVFDMRLREGNKKTFQHAIQLGVLGVDLSSEGPISKEQGSSYLFNYRYSTTKLLEHLRGKENMGGSLGYQDFNVKLSFPTERYGDFKIWGIGLMDEVEPIIENSENWSYMEEGFLAAAKQRSGAAGLGHDVHFSNGSTSLHTHLAFTHLENRVDEQFWVSADRVTDRTALRSRNDSWVIGSKLVQRFHATHRNETGITLTRYNQALELDLAPDLGLPMEQMADYNGHTELLSVYSQSRITLPKNMVASLGLNLQYFALNKQWSVEPRAALKWAPASRHSVALGYGLHSRMERPDIYFLQTAEGAFPNRNLGLTRGHHVLFTYQWHLRPDMFLQLEPYYQYLYRVPVAADGGSFSILNRDTYYFSQALVARGNARNYGVDMSFSKYMKNGLYYRGTLSLFDSKYRDGSGRWFHSSYNRGFIVNLLAGKEWMIGRNRLGVNARISWLGGKRYTPVDPQATLDHPYKQVQYQDDQAYANQFEPMVFGDFSITYRMNRDRVGHEFAIKSVNATGQKDYLEHRYHLAEQKIVPFSPVNSLFNVSYRFDF